MFQLARRKRSYFQVQECNLEVSSTSWEWDQELIFDIFPTAVCTDETDFKLVSAKRFENQYMQSFPFIAYQDSDRIMRYYSLISPKTESNERDPLQDRFSRLMKSARDSHFLSGNCKIGWKQVGNKLSKAPRLSHQQKRPTPKKCKPDEKREGHIDDRSGFLLQNMYLVRRYFTFGERRVENGEVHIVQTTDAPLLFFTPKPQFVHQFQHIPGSFRPYLETKFDGYVLHPHSKYIIPTRTTYLLFTVQKTLFGFDKCIESVVESLCLHHILQNPYDSPLSNEEALDLRCREAFKKSRILNQKNITPKPIDLQPSTNASIEPVYQDGFWTNTASIESVYQDGSWTNAASIEPVYQENLNPVYILPNVENSTVPSNNFINFDDLCSSLQIEM